MTYKKLFLFFCLIISIDKLFCRMVNCPLSRLQKVNVYDNSITFSAIGFDNCSMLFNGEELIIQKFIQDNDVVFDVGANKGEWSKKVCNSKQAIKLYAFEPIPTTFERLKSNLESVNKLCFNIGLSNKKSNETFFYYTLNADASEVSSCFHRPILDEIFNTTAHTITVRTDTLDSFCSCHNIAFINFLKIDTEGSELNILLGAADLLKKGAIDIIQFEYGGTYLDARITLKGIYCLLRKHYYYIFRIIPGGLVEIPQWKAELDNFKYSNYLAICEKSFCSQKKSNFLLSCPILRMILAQCN